MLEAKTPFDVQGMTRVYFSQISWNLLGKTATMEELVRGVEWVTKKVIVVRVVGGRKEKTPLEVGSEKARLLDARSSLGT